MGNINSIEELKNSEEIKNLVKESIKTIYSMQNEYKSKIESEVSINVKSDNIGSNNVSSGGGVMIGKGDKGINIKQLGNVQTEMQTVYYSNFLSKSGKSPIVKLICSDMLEMTEKDNFDEEMPNFYDPVYIMTMLGFNVKSAEFDFDKGVIRYEINDETKNNLNGGGSKSDDTEDLEFDTLIQEMSLDDLYEKLTNGYMGKISEKIVNVKEEIKNLKNNIERSTYNYASNRIVVKNVILEDVDVLQKNESIQKMFDDFDELETKIENIKNGSDVNGSGEMAISSISIKSNKSNQPNSSNSSPESTNQPNSSSTNSTISKYISSITNDPSTFKLILILILVIIIFFISLFIYQSKRKTSTRSIRTPNNAL